MKTCQRCLKCKPLDQYKPAGRPSIKLTDLCKTCRRNLSKTKYIKSRSKGDREVVMQHYGYLCACCGETEKEFLTLDHKEGGGNKERKKLRQWFWPSIRNRGFPDCYQVLCMNCNWAKGNLGKCPHTFSAA